MFKVLFKGQMEPVFINDSQGITLQERFKSGVLKGKTVTLNDNVYEGSSIKAILAGFSDPDSQISKEKNMEKIRQIHHEHSEWRKKRIATSPKERAKSTAFMNMLCQAIRGRKLTIDEEKDVIRAQEAWFTAHPDFHNANPTCYFSKDDIQMLKNKIAAKKDAAISIGDQLAINAIDYAERHLKTS